MTLFEPGNGAFQGLRVFVGGHGAQQRLDGFGWGQRMETELNRAGHRASGAGGALR